jgi:hypothetical protein
MTAPLKMTYVPAQLSAPMHDFMRLMPKTGTATKLSYTPTIPTLLPDVYCPMLFRRKQIRHNKKNILHKVRQNCNKYVF